ncbi:dynein regulatory complex protein 8 [Austrofundulus limnaeus]|uniref:Dynein regulatory complex protein 8 n=1 Tax=Austrofundulus limnaeus TaxID=52670 RepID=A0A2I4AP80_AUSLI|nr:PREDICTED: EF-hand calcium-binding domain-containing protein 2 [Austrofundulus limnaeus]
MADNNQSAEAQSDIHKKIRSAFKTFDFLSNNTVEACEINSVIYSLGCFPTQADLHAFISEVGEDNSGFIELDKFLPAMTKILLEHRFPPIPEERLLQAFEVLDKEKKGYLEPEELRKYMTEEGEPFTQEEMEEMLTALVDNKQKCVLYKEVIGQLVIDPDT